MGHFFRVGGESSFLPISVLPRYLLYFRKQIRTLPLLCTGTAVHSEKRKRVKQMDKSIGISSQFVVALLVMAFIGGASIARGDARPAQKPAAASQPAAKASTPETNVLMQHDDVLPTQNRTQAMAIEAENGKLPSGEEDELKRRGFVKQVTQANKK